MEELNKYFENLKLFIFKKSNSDDFFTELYSNGVPWEYCLKFIIIGFYTPKGSTFDVVIGGQKICRNQTKDNDFIFAIRDQYIIPYVKLKWHKLELDLKENHEVFVIYGKINEQILQTFIKYPVYCFIDTYPVYSNNGTFSYDTDPKYLIYISGMAGMGSSKDPEITEYIDLPILNKINYQELAKERTKVISQELMEITWHPSRFRRWCLDYTDEFYLNN
jgi:hypothetical protein